ncbi:phage tail assembly chaperone [Pararhizobium gei]|uniref:phage tail assembly chaperone n=1 Tax=Pararhizobium gei TaxID=1395951 RepID=UPI0023D9929D|nr:hypothetical protein [Rhizobium gei]
MTRLIKQLSAELARNLAEGGKPRIPAGGDLIWKWFLDLNGGRDMHAAGANPIRYSEIEAYARLHRLPLRSDHIAALRAMDAVYFQHLRSLRPTDGIKRLPARSSAPMTGELFDAMFG